MSYPWIHESEIDAARAEAEAGDILGDEGRAFQRRIEASLEADPEFRAWADAKHLERWGHRRVLPEPEPELEAGP
jgi:hypothetical protein